MFQLETRGGDRPKIENATRSMPMNVQKIYPLRFLVIAGLLTWLTLAFITASKKSAAVDEVPYIGAGLSTLEFFDFRMNPEHPPLVKTLGVLPLYLVDKPPMHMPNFGFSLAPSGLSPWYQGYAGHYSYCLLFLADDQNVQHRLLLARIVPIVIGLLGGLFAFLWGRALSGSSLGGIAAAVLLLFYPEYLGHACFLALDVPLLVSCAAVSWFARCWWRHPHWKNGLYFILASSVASLVKLPAAMFVVLCLLTLAVLSLFSAGRIRMRALLLLALGTALAGIFAAWAGSGFRFSYLPEDAMVQYRNRLIPPGFDPDATTLRRVVNFFWRHKLLPETTLAGFNLLGSFEQRTYFLNGALSGHGWYHYYLITFLLKTPLPIIAASLFLLIAAVIRTMRYRSSFTWGYRVQRYLLLVMPFALLALLIVLSRFNIGHRHILFIYFPLSVCLGVEAARWIRSGGWRRALACTLLVAQLIICLLAFPHLSTYFNVLGGSPYRASRYLRDSSTEWGQDLPFLADALSRLGFKKANLALYGLNRPESYGIRDYVWIIPKDYPLYMPGTFQSPDPLRPTAISVNYLWLVRERYPGLFDREPDLELNSIVLYLPNTGT